MVATRGSTVIHLSMLLRVKVVVAKRFDCIFFQVCKEGLLWRKVAVVDGGKVQGIQLHLVHE